MSKRTATVIRIITTAPVTALVLLILLRLLKSDFFISDLHFVLHLSFLCALPALSYLFSRTVPALKARGRSLERNMAIVFSVAGYAGSFITAVCFTSTAYEKILASTYLFSAVLTAFFTLIKFKSSGHACSLSGPAIMLCYCVSPWFAFTFLLLAPIYASSLRLKRHTLLQLICGTVIPIAATFISVLIFL